MAPGRIWLRRLVFGAALAALALGDCAGAAPPTQDQPVPAEKPAPSNNSRITISAAPSLQGAPPARSEGDGPEPALRLPSPAHLLAPTEAEARLELTARYLPPPLAEPDRPAGDRRWEVDLPASQRDMLAGPMAHPAGRSTVADVCPAPPDPGWLIELKAQWAQYRYGNAEPMAGQPSYLPFRCY